MLIKFDVPRFHLTKTNDGSEEPLPDMTFELEVVWFSTVFIRVPYVGQAYIGRGVTGAYGRRRVVWDSWETIKRSKGQRPNGHRDQLRSGIAHSQAQQR